MTASSNKPEPSKRNRPTVTLRDDGIVHIDYGKLTAVTVDFARYTFRARQELTGGRAVPILFSGDELVHIDREASDFAASPQVAATILAAAVVPKRFMIKQLARLFIWYTRPPYPCRVFSDYDEAIDWLRDKAKLP